MNTIKACLHHIDMPHIDIWNAMNVIKSYHRLITTPTPIATHVRGIWTMLDMCPANSIAYNPINSSHFPTDLNLEESEATQLVAMNIIFIYYY